MSSKLKYWFAKFYGWLMILFKKDIVSYNTLVCSDCLEILHGHTDIDYIQYWDCPRCGQIKHTDLDRNKPIGTVVIK